MMKNYNRRHFVIISAFSGLGLTLSPLIGRARSTIHPNEVPKGKRIGVIGLDTSHSEVFSRMINQGIINNKGYQVTVAYHPRTNRDILDLVPKISSDLKSKGIKVVDTMDALLSNCDLVLLESIDGTVHLEQALAVFEAKKPVFIDKPLSATLKGAEEIIDASKRYGVPFFSSSALRFDSKVQSVVKGAIGRVNGADVFTPADLESQHLDMAWYAIHGLEMLYAVFGVGCRSVSRIKTKDTDLITGIWKDGRIGIIRGVRNSPVGIAGTAFGAKGTAPLGPFSQDAYQELVQQIIDFFDSRTPPVSTNETLEMFRFMDAVNRSIDGQKISV